MIDVHCHLLPGIDDGAHDEAMTLAMARAAVDSGVRAMVCTPHHGNGVFENPRARILEAVRAAQGLLDDHAIALKLHPGSELHLVPELPRQLASGEALTVNDRGRYALVELPKHTVPVGAEALLERLAGQGVTPVIAHPERNSALRRDPERASRWVAAGCRLQLTGQSVTGAFGAAIARVCRHWLVLGDAHLVASDGHRPTGRSPRLDQVWQVLSERYGEEAARRLLVVNPDRLIRGLALLPVEVRNDGGRSLLRRVLEQVRSAAG